MTSKHTPTPWLMQEIGKEIYIRQINEDGIMSIAQICKMEYKDVTPEQLASAALICKAVNHYGELVEALETITHVGSLELAKAVARALLAKLGEV